MKLEVRRVYDNGKATIGMLFVNGKYECLTLEDEHREVKVFAETRIPAGTYKIGLRTEGGHHETYKRRYGDKHIGMLQIMDVPNFTNILIHIGNLEKDTAGCLLVGDFPPAAGSSVLTIGSSRAAYERLYSKVTGAILSGENIIIKYTDNPEDDN